MRGVVARGNSISITFTYKGVQCRETIGLIPNTSNLLYVSRKREAILFQIVNGTFEYGEHFPNSKTKTAKLFSSEFSARTTIEELLVSWLKNIRRTIQLSTEKYYTSAIYYHLIPNFGHLNLSDLSPQHIHNWINNQSISNKRINNVLIPLRAVVKNAFVQGKLKNNIFNTINYLPVEAREPNPLSPEEIMKVLEQLSGQTRNYIQFAIWTGLRTSELIALKWSDFDEVNKSVYICRAKVLGQEKEPKTKKGRRNISLLSGAMTAIQSQKRYTFKTSDYVFHDPRKNLPWKNDQAIRKVYWYPALKRAGLARRSVYQTRHTFASLALSSGENFMWVSKQLGHDKPSTTLRFYGRYINQVDSQCGLKLESIMQNQNGAR